MPSAAEGYSSPNRKGDIARQRRLVRGICHQGIPAAPPVEHARKAKLGPAIRPHAPKPAIMGGVMRISQKKLAIKFFLNRPNLGFRHDATWVYFPLAFRPARFPLYLSLRCKYRVRMWTDSLHDPHWVSHFGLSFIPKASLVSEEILSRFGAMRQK